MSKKNIKELQNLLLKEQARNYLIRCKPEIMESMVNIAGKLKTSRNKVIILALKEFISKYRDKKEDGKT